MSRALPILPSRRAGSHRSLAALAVCLAAACGSTGGGDPSSCVAEADAAFCSAAEKNCGSVSGTDNCGAARTAECGNTCPSGETCVSNVCAASGGGPSASRESWICVYIEYQSSLGLIANHASSFTHVVPMLYSVNYNYASGVAYYSNCPTSSGFICSGNASTPPEGIDPASFAASVAALGMETVPAIYAGSANGGTEAGIVNILTNATTQDAFITAMTAEAVKNGYSGYNLDWEVGGTVDYTYASKFVSFVDNFKAALVAAGIKNPTLSVDAVVSNVNGSYCSSNTGYLDFPSLAASSIDRVIIEDYVSTPGSATMSCQNVVLDHSNPVGCDYSMTGMLNMMCSPNLGATPALDFGKAVIALEADPSGTNPILGATFSALESYGFEKVAVWPQYQSAADPFLSNANDNPASDTWYALLAAFLSK